MTSLPLSVYKIIGSNEWFAATQTIAWGISGVYLPSNGCGHFLDIHQHQAPGRPYALYSLDTRDAVDAILQTGWFSLGIHPWFIHQQDWQASLRRIETCQSPGFLAIGECGLDKAIDLSMELQLEVFERQIELSEALGKPLIVHCVRAFNELLALKKTLGVKQAWIIHGFSGGVELARQLIKQDCYLSWGAALLRPQSLAQRVLPELPLNRQFLETDAANVSISEIYSHAATILSLEKAELSQAIVNNFKRVFPHV